MRIFSWILREIFYRKATAFLFFSAVAAAVFLSTGSLSLLAVEEVKLERHFARQRQLLADQMTRVWDDYRKMTKDLGFNVLILPDSQEVADFYADNFASRYMPETYADSLAASPIVTVEHILPTLMQRVFWTEKKRSILVCGVRGELPRSRQPVAEVKRAPIMPPVPPGSVVCGSELCADLSLHTGDTLTFLGRRFRVAQCHPERGNRDDITMWMELDSAQKLFGKEDLINGIMALECRCAADKQLPNLAKIRTDLAHRLPGTKVIEFMSQVIARAEARYAAVETREKALELEKKDATVRMERRRGFGMLFALAAAVTACTGTIILTFFNIRSRLKEAAMLQAMGFGTLRLFALFEGRIAVLGTAGTVIGVIPVIAALAAGGRLSGILPPVGHPVGTLLPAAGIVAGMVPALAASGAGAVLYGLSRPTAILLERNV